MLLVSPRPPSFPSVFIHADPALGQPCFVAGDVVKRDLGLGGRLEATVSLGDGDGDPTGSGRKTTLGDLLCELTHAR